MTPSRDSGTTGRPGAAAARRPLRCLRAALVRLSGALDPEAERAFGLALDRALSGWLPALGAVFGIAVVLFAAWDYWIAPQQARTTALLRLSLVLIGAMGYFEWRARIPIAWRCALVYGTHTGAMIVSAALLPNGLLLALPAIAGAMFPLALVEPRLHRLYLIVLVPSLVFVMLGAAVLPQQIFVSSMLVYMATLALAGIVALTQGRWRRAAFMAEQSLTHAARHDSLCGVFARGYLIELATHDVGLATRYGRPLAIAMIDIDHFKRVNDTFGHAAGDTVLRAVSRVCAAQLRASDYVGRVGGEEFICVMPETVEKDALACAERMRQAVAAMRLDTPVGTICCTISIGIATLHEEIAELSALLAAADAAMYLAKSCGRNRVVLAPSHHCP